VLGGKPCLSQTGFGLKRAGRAGEVVERFPAMLAQVSLASHP